MGSPLRSLAATILVFEACVLFFAALVAKDLSNLSPELAVSGGAALAFACVLAAGLLRWRAGYVVGWVLQGVMIATGVIVPMMFGIGLLFTALWAFALYTGTRIERERAAFERAAGKSSTDDSGSTRGPEAS